MRKKVLAVLLSAAMVLGLTACGGSKQAAGGAAPASQFCQMGAEEMGFCQAETPVNSLGNSVRHQPYKIVRNLGGFHSWCPSFFSCTIDVS